MRNFLLILLSIILHISPSALQSCGKVQFSAGLIVNGDEVKHGEFPFLVALLKLKNQQFFCGGNLITQKHALTASHCILDKKNTMPLQPEDIIAQIGKYSLKSVYEKGAVAKEISQIFVHEDWKAYTTQYDADIALLVFESEVQLSEYIQVVCLPFSTQANDLIEGHVVGYGVSERTDFQTVENTPRKAASKKPPSNENCFLENPLLVSISSRRTFCGGGENKGACSGDSGGGFYVKRNSTWYLQGIVSSSLLSGQRQCDVTTYAIFTNVALFADWVWEKVNGQQSVQLQCGYDISDTLSSKPYYCEVDMKILTDNVVITSAVGKHMSGKSNADVGLLDFGPDDDNEKREVRYIPSGIGKVFPNLRLLYIQKCMLKSISRRNFEHFDRLSTISFTENLIEHIDADTFYDVPLLYSLRINGNRLKIIPLELFINSPRLQHVIFDGNQIKELNGNQLFRNNPKLVSIDFEDNKLAKIKINLSAFTSLKKAIFNSNQCINDRFGSGSTRTIAELQDIINKSC